LPGNLDAWSIVAHVAFAENFYPNWVASRAAWLGEEAWSLITVAMAAMIWAAVSKRPAWGSEFLGVRPLAFVGRISYSMYPYHLPLLLLFNQYAPPLGGLLSLLTSRFWFSPPRYRSALSSVRSCGRLADPLAPPST
jgi:peptidoglycan/LPS O-acetylase OafA/YrhL